MTLETRLKVKKMLIGTLCKWPILVPLIAVVLVNLQVPHANKLRFDEFSNKLYVR